MLLMRLKIVLSKKFASIAEAEQTPVMKMTWNGKEMAILAPPTRPRKTEPYVPASPKKSN
jgi:hypothetical protein